MEQTDTTDELAAFLEHYDRQDRYVVARVLKQTPTETTQLVRYPGADGGELGPFIRKYLTGSSGTGGAYRLIFHAQQHGLRLASLPRIVECAVAGEELVVVMEYIRGQTLAAAVAAAGPSPAFARRWMPRICRAVAEFHEAFEPPLIHRDLKPSNIMLAGETPVIIDFGIARRYREGAAADTERFGTRGYAAPEQYGFGQTSVRSDVYALGMLLAFCCTGEDPVVVLTREELACQGVPEPVIDVALRATAFDPARRYASARELASAITAAFEHACGQQADADAADVAPPTPEAAPSCNAATARATTAHPAAQHRSGDADVRHPEGSVPHTAPMACAGEGFVRGLRAMAARVARAFARIPTWAGRLWNAVVLIAFALFALGALQQPFHPLPEDLAYPFWFRIVEYWFMLLPEFAAIAYLLLDRRRIRRRIPALHGVTWRQELKACLLVFTVPLLATMALLVLFV